MKQSLRFFHISDLHLGKRLFERSLIEDQEYILGEILSLADVEKPDAVVIAGDVYDKGVPVVEAVKLFDSFLCALSERNIRSLVIAGNHDSSERLSFAARLLDKSGVHIAGVFNGAAERVVMHDEFGRFNFYLLPFIKPADARRFYDEEEIESYTDAVAAAVKHSDVDLNERNVLVTHQFVTGATRCDSEDISVGGTDNVSLEVFDGFDYVALGHIHSPQNAGSEKVRYCGTPLKYSFSEVGHKKSVSIVEINEKGSLRVRQSLLSPLRDAAELRGSYSQLMMKSFYGFNPDRESYLKIVLTDQQLIPDVADRLRTVYPNLLRVEYEALNDKSAGERQEELSRRDNLTPDEMFAEFYKAVNNIELTGSQARYIRTLFEEEEDDS